MQSDVADLRSTIIPRSDQLNADQLLGGEMTITVSDVRAGGTEDQPVSIHYPNDNGRPYKPAKTMRKLLIFAWGADGRAWVGRSMTLYNDPNVKFGGDLVGGIRISHLSHIDRPISVSLTSTKGKKAMYSVKPLKVEPPRVVAAPVDHATAIAEFEQIAREHGMQAFVDAWNATPKANRPPIAERDRIAAIAQASDKPASA